MSSSATLLMRAAGLTDTGRVRSRNEDSFVLAPEGGLAVVCDGMGGHAGGDIASRTAAAAVADILLGVGDAAGDERALVVEAVAYANQTLTDINDEQGNSALRAMGTTLVALWRAPGADRAVVFHAGDSRAYRLRGGRLEQLTRDHSLYQVWLDGGGRGVAPQKNIIMRALGATGPVEPDVRIEELSPGDLFLLCTDGLTGMLDDDDIAAVLSGEPDLESACARLVDMTNLAGGVDNVTVVLARFVPAGS